MYWRKSCSEKTKRKARKQNGASPLLHELPVHNAQNCERQVPAVADTMDLSHKMPCFPVVFETIVRALLNDTS